MDLPQLIGQSPSIAALRAQITRLLVAAARGPRPPAVLIQGETGTGKGLVASLLHRTSSRARAAFVDVNCAAIPESLLESELFGYERGAFTDARRSKPGLFQEAHRGTLFLDEVGLLPLALQAKLLTVLEARAVRRLGATQTEAVDAWIVSARNADLAGEVRARRFREDLFHRLAVVRIEMPPLRERPEDIALLAEHILERGSPGTPGPPRARGRRLGQGARLRARRGDRALRAAVTPKAVEYYEHGLDALGRGPENSRTRLDAIDLRLRLRDALWPLGRMPEVLAHLREAESMAVAAQDDRCLGWISCYLCQSFWAVADNERALEAGRRALDIARRLDDLALEAETSFYVGISHHARGDFRRASDSLAESVSVVDRAVSTEDERFPSRRFAVNGRAIVRSYLTRSLAELGRFEEGERWGREAVQIAEAIASAFALVAATAGLATVYIRREELPEALPLLEQGLELCRTYSLHNWFPHVAASLGHTLVGLGRVADGIDLIEQAMSDAAQSGIRTTSSFGFIYLGSAYLRAGYEVKAAEAARHALDIGHDARGIQAWALWVLGEVEASGSRVDRAERDYTDALTRAAELEMRPLMLRCHLGLARLGGGGAQRHGEQAADLARELAMTLPIPISGA